MPPPAGRAAAPPLAARTPTPLPRRVAARTAVADRSPPSGPPPAAAPAAAPPPRAGPLVLDSAVLHSATPRQLEVIAALTPRFGAEALPLLGAPAEMWQPADFLPDTDGSRGEAFFDDVRELRARAAGLPDALLAVLVGDMVTEEALPTYMAQLNTLDGVRDETGCDPTPWGRWTRAWVAEENRHGDALHKYLWLTGRVDGRAVERTVQRLVGAGMDPGFENNPYLGLVYTSFQERATKISHGATARLAAAAGDAALARLAGAVAADEGRHEAAYTRAMAAVFEADPDGAVLAFDTMMRKRVVMPAHLMDDGVHGCASVEESGSRGAGGGAGSNNDNYDGLGDNDGSASVRRAAAAGAGAGARRNLFDDFSAAAEDLGVYTAADYVAIMDHLLARWRVAELRGLSEAAAAAQARLLALPARTARAAERRAARRARAPRARVPFSWLAGRAVELVA